MIFLVYCMLARKFEDLYGELFDVISQHVSEHPLSIITDCEKANENAIKQKLPTTLISACFFSILKCLW